MGPAVRMVLLCGAIVLALAAPAAADGPGWGRRPSSRSATRRSPARAAAGPATPTSPLARRRARLDAYAPPGGSGEEIRGCHRSRAAQAHLGGGITSLNLACSGAKTTTGGTGSGQDFKPGIDFYSDASGRKGQARALQDYAATRNVKAVVLMIGANNYGFAAIVERCVTNWLTSPSWLKNYCQRRLLDGLALHGGAPGAGDGERRRRVPARPHRDDERRLRRLAVQGDRPDLLVADPADNGFRYPETGWTRQSIGGCGTWNRDANWANDTVVTAMNNSVTNGAAQSGLTNVVTLDLVDSLVGRRLCENTVGLLEETGTASWQSAGAVDRSEWVAQIRTVTTIVGPYQLQESGARRATGASSRCATACGRCSTAATSSAAGSASAPATG